MTNSELNSARLKELAALRDKLELELAAVKRWILAIEDEQQDAVNFERIEREIE